MNDCGRTGRSPLAETAEEPRWAVPVWKGMAALVVLLTLIAVRAAQPPGETASSGLGGPPVLPPGDPATNVPIKDLGNGRYRIGEVTLDKQARAVSFPAVVNMNTALVEYFVVAEGGKTHESVLRTAARPFDIHVAMLLLGAKAATTADPAVFHDSKKPVPGDEIGIELKWRDGERTIGRPAEDWIYNLETRKSMTPGSWVYNGSQVVEGSFVAQREGSIVSIMADPYSLANNPRVGRENDEIWLVNTNAVPGLNTRVEVTFKLK